VLHLFVREAEAVDRPLRQLPGQVEQGRQEEAG
jgi:hypothetical protein